MTSWPPEEAAGLAAAYSLHLTVGTAPHPGVEVGMVVVDGELYVRAFRGRCSEWFRAALPEARGRISVGAIDRDVILRPDRGDVGDIDAAYYMKYGINGALTTNSRSRDATLRVIPA